MRPLPDFRPALLAMAPTLGAALTLTSGAILLASGATPSNPTRIREMADLLETAYVPAVLIDISHFVSSVVGLMLILLAFGLRARLGAAWVGTQIMLAAAAVLALFKGFAWEETVALLFMFVLIAPMRPAFTRNARLTRMEITPGWLLSAVAVVLGAWLVGVWSFTNTDLTDQNLLRVLANPDAERAIRSSAGASILLLVIGVWRLLATPATPQVAGEADTDFARVRAILAQAQGADPSANLALLGDKRFFFSKSGESFLMFGVRGRSWIGMGPPVGRKDERAELLWRFREQADAHAARPGFYGLSPEDLPDMVDLGFSIQKTGESALVPLESFSLAGRRRGVLRRSWRKVGEEGGCFEVLPSGAAVEAVMPELKRVSDSWLASHSGGEKTFSLGGFDPRYVSEFPVAIVRAATALPEGDLAAEPGPIVAFATLWTSATLGAFSIDLMRYGDDAPKDIMDYLFVELIAWGRDQGYQAFDFGVAPLAGLEDRPLAPLMSRVGRLLFDRGEDIYNFQGVRKFKDKFDPAWRPHYIAAERKWSIPVLLADVGLLSSGGMAGLTKRAKKDEAVKAPPAPPLAEAQSSAAE
ncbi:MAG: bifunctional lysylphosphatidylglycerol flippase/synthetase MprF [Caulobacter sp.]|nr:bifunctional lysylphosphatidylglycerol flippase/synthetase MprF [Caulobacter sp.]